MAMHLVLNGTAEDFLTSIAQHIKGEVSSFFGELRKEGKYEMFKELPPFAQRVAFFHEVGYGSRPYQMKSISLGASMKAPTGATGITSVLMKCSRCERV